MLVIYLMALILGGGILFIQLISGLGDGADHAFEAHHPLHGPGILSTRPLTFGLFAFGFVGAPLQTLGLTRPALGFALAIGSGLASAVLVSLTLRAAGHPSASGAAAFLEAKGSLARVVIPCGRDHRGKIRVLLKGQLVDMMATTDEDHIPSDASVRIIDVKDDIAHVAALGPQA